MDCQIQNLVAFKFNIPEEYVSVSITFKLFLTMIDSKVGNALTDNNSTQRCFVCNASSKNLI